MKQILQSFLNAEIGSLFCFGPGASSSSTSLCSGGDRAAKDGIAEEEKVETRCNERLRGCGDHLCCTVGLGGCECAGCKHVEGPQDSRGPQE